MLIRGEDNQKVERQGSSPITTVSNIGAQPVDETLTALAELVGSENTIILCVGPDLFLIGQLTDAYVASENKDGVAGTASLRTLGTGATQAAAGDHAHAYQPVDGTLTALSGLTIAANQIILGTGADSFSMISCTSAGQALLDDATAADQLVTLGAVGKALFDAHTILAATTDDTPAALTVGEQTVVGRATGGNIAALVIDSDLSSVSANDDTIPSAKATKAMGDLKVLKAGDIMTGTLTVNTSSGYAIATRLGNLDLGQDTTLNVNMRSHHDTAANGPYISYYRSKGTETSKTAVAANTVLGAIRAYAYETTSEPDAYAQVASLKLEATEGHTDVTKGTRFTIATTPEGAASEVDRLRITGTGLTRIGAATGSDYIQFSTNGFCTLAGTAKSKLSMRPTIIASKIVKVGSDYEIKPTQVDRGASSGYSLPIYASDDEEIFFNEAIAGRWDGASDITVSVYGYLSAAEDVGDDFCFRLSWACKSYSTGVWPSATTDVDVWTNIETDRAAQYSRYQVDFVVDWDSPTPDIAAADLFCGRLYRVAVGGGYTEITGEFVVQAIKITYTVDKMYKAA